MFDTNNFNMLAKIPNDLTEAFTALDIIMSGSEPEEVEWFKNTPEDECIGATHNGIGRWIRNEWGLWNKESIMYKYLNAMGLWHADDMSGILLTSYHRYLNKKELDLKGQIQTCLDFWSAYEKDNGPVTK